MHLLNFGLGELLGLFFVLGGAVTALYLLDRSRRGVAVATLRFWTQADRPVVATTRRRIRQWASLLLQLSALLLLLLAMAQVRWGSREDGSRDHVLILDTSSWTAARDGKGALLDQAKAQALAYVKALPAVDRVMVVYADALATPATGFESDRGKVESAIRAARSGAAALDLRQALEFAAHARGNAKRGGEIVFAGAGRALLRQQGERLPAPENLRLLLPDSQPENLGLRKVSLRRAAGQADLWQALIAVRNYGSRRRGAALVLLFGGAPVGTRQLRLDPGAEQEMTFEFTTRAAGIVEAQLRSRDDSFPEDDYAALELPAAPQIRIAACTVDASAIRPLLAAHPVVTAAFLPPGECAPEGNADLVLLDRVAPRGPLRQPSIWIEPPAAGAPVRIRSTVGDARIVLWRADHPLGRGLRARDVRLTSTAILEPAPGDIVVAEAEQGPVILARPAREGAAAMVVLGFHPMRTRLRYELSTPLLFANILQWLEPESFRRWEIQASSVGTVAVPVGEELTPEQVKVSDARRQSLPFTITAGTLRFFSALPGTVRVQTGGEEQVYSLTLPEVPETAWEPPAEAARGIPARKRRPAPARDIWYWVALAAAVILLAEYLRYGPKGREDLATGLLRALRVDRWRNKRAVPLRRAS